MDRAEIARVLAEIAAMLELAGENRFKVRAYETGAQAILSLPGDLKAAVASRHLLGVPGIGAKLFESIETLLETGSLPDYEKLRARFPPGLRECLRIPGLGARKARQLHEALGIDSLEALEAACRDGRLAAVKGFGPRTAEQILKGIALVRSSAGLHRYSRTRARAQETLAALKSSGLVSRIEIAGSLRRRREIVRNIDMVAASADSGPLADAFRRLPWVADIVEEGPTRVSARFADGVAADLRIVSDAQFPAAWLYFTGSKEHNAGLGERAKRMGLKWTESGLFRIEPPGPALAAGSEDEIYAALALPFIEPELREGRGEIEAAERGELPTLVSRDDLRGIIHAHTVESDGRDTLEDMIAAARAADYSWAAITDHSKTAAYAGGLNEERVLAQRDEIRALQKRSPGFRIFHGTEADILADGSVDFGDEFLGAFDLVVASIHSRFGLPRADQTARLLRAVRNPRVSVLGHPTGRLLLSREGVDADIEAVLDGAAEAGCALEINGSPERLDLDWRLVRRAAEKGAVFSIGPDAHSVGELGYVELALGMARKGWVHPAATLNAMTSAELVKWLERRRGGPLAAA